MKNTTFDLEQLVRAKISQWRFAMRDPILGMDHRHDERCRKSIASLVDQLREIRTPQTRPKSTNHDTTI